MNYNLSLLKISAGGLVVLIQSINSVSFILHTFELLSLCKH